MKGVVMRTTLLQLLLALSCIGLCQASDNDDLLRSSIFSRKRAVAAPVAQEPSWTDRLYRFTTTLPSYLTLKPASTAIAEAQTEQQVAARPATPQQSQASQTEALASYMALEPTDTDKLPLSGSSDSLTPPSTSSEGTQTPDLSASESQTQLDSASQLESDDDSIQDIGTSSATSFDEPETEYLTAAIQLQRLQGDIERLQASIQESQQIPDDQERRLALMGNLVRYIALAKRVFDQRPQGYQSSLIKLIDALKKQRNAYARYLDDYKPSSTGEKALETQLFQTFYRILSAEFDFERPFHVLRLENAVASLLQELINYQARGPKQKID